MQGQDDDLPVFGQEMANNQGVDNYPDVLFALFQMVDDLEEDEKEDYFIRDTDALIVTGKIVLISSYLGTRVFQFISLCL